MALGPKSPRRNDSVPPTSSEPPTCSAESSGEKCGGPHYAWLSFQVEVLGKLVNIKKSVCKTHYDRIVPQGGFNASGS